MDLTNITTDKDLNKIGEMVARIGQMLPLENRVEAFMKHTDKKLKELDDPNSIYGKTIGESGRIAVKHGVETIYAGFLLFFDKEVKALEAKKAKAESQEEGKFAGE